MAVDADLIGVITASTAVGVCLCVVIVLAGCVCHMRLESKRRKAEKSRMMALSLYPPHIFPPGIADGDMSIDQVTRIGGYRPRILSPNSPRGSASFHINNTRSSMNGSPRHPHSPRREPHQSSSAPMYSNSFKANGHVLVPISLAAQHYGAVTASGTQDFYDARATSATSMPIRPYQSHEVFIDTEYYPDEIFESPVIQQQNKMQKASPDSPSDRNSPPQPATQQVDNVDKTVVHDAEINRKDEETKSPDTDSKHSKGSSLEKDQGISNINGSVNQINEEANINSSQYKVIKKHHGHVKMPEWMVREYEEAESSIEVEEEQPLPSQHQEDETTEVNQAQGTVSVMVGDYSESNGVTRESRQDPSSDPTKAGAMSWSSTVEESTTSIIQDYSSANYIKDFTILDYVDTLPPPLPLPPPPSDLNENSLEPTSPRTEQSDNVYDEKADNVTDNNDNNNNTNEDDTDTDIKERKAAVLRQIRQKVNESAERMPPAFTSTPRVEPEASPEESLPPPPSLDEMGMSRRQRHENEGSLDELPPIIGDTRL